MPKIAPEATELPASKAEELESTDSSCASWTEAGNVHIKQGISEPLGFLCNPGALEEAPMMTINKFLAHPGR